MRAVRLADHGGPDVLRVEDIDRPEPGPDEVLVEVAAASVNPVDTYFREGSYTPVGLPFTPGVDFAGTVVSVGTDVNAFDTGDRVLGAGVGNAAHQGAYAEYVTAPEQNIALVPAGVDLVEAGAAPVVAATAWRALVELADLEPAEDCLVHGGAGGVGHAAVQIGAATNARVIATAGPEYLDAVSDLGADTVLRYDREDLADAVTDAAENGVDVILDHRIDDYLQFDTDVAATGARIVGIGENDPKAAFNDVNAARSVDAHYTFMSLFNAPNLRRCLAGVAHLMGTGALDLQIEQRYSLDEAAAAQRAVMNDSFLGKLVVEP